MRDYGMPLEKPQATCVYHRCFAPPETTALPEAQSADLSVSGLRRDSDCDFGAVLRFTLRPPLLLVKA